VAGVAPPLWMYSTCNADICTSGGFLIAVVDANFMYWITSLERSYFLVTRLSRGMKTGKVMLLESDS
jgi:hypothetical protein